MTFYAFGGKLETLSPGVAAGIHLQRAVTSLIAQGLWNFAGRSYT
jgi:hypothetical protein